MRHIQVQEAVEHFSDLIAEAEAGQRVALLRDGEPVAQIIPFPGHRHSRGQRMAALQRLDALMEKGYDISLAWNGRDELYDRDHD